MIVFTWCCLNNIASCCYHSYWYPWSLPVPIKFLSRVMLSIQWSLLEVKGTQTQSIKLILYHWCHKPRHSCFCSYVWLSYHYSKTWRGSNGLLNSEMYYNIYYYYINYIYIIVIIYFNIVHQRTTDFPLSTEAINKIKPHKTTKKKKKKRKCELLQIDNIFTPFSSTLVFQGVAKLFFSVGTVDHTTCITIQ